jgi:hypothetical protein
MGAFHRWEKALRRWVGIGLVGVLLAGCGRARSLGSQTSGEGRPRPAGAPAPVRRDGEA